MTAAPPVLFVGHDASRTGAPIVAGALLRWIARTGATEVRLVLLRGGPLAPDLAGTVPTTVATGPEVAAGRALGPAAHAPRLRLAARRFARPPVVVANTVAAWAAAATVGRRSALVCWVHELDHVADALVPAAERPALVAATDRFLAVSEPVRAMLVERWCVPAEKVLVIEPFADPPTPEVRPGQQGVRLLGAGTLVPRKGPDLFVAALASLPEPARALLGHGGAAWVGGPLGSPTAALVAADRHRAGLDEVLVLPGEQPTLGPWWPDDGLLLHPAREDPAPLVVLEAAQRAVPVATWRTGGAADLLAQAGCDDLVAPAGDLLALAERAGELLVDPSARAEVGRALQVAAAARSTDHGAPRALDAILGAR